MINGYFPQVPPRVGEAEVAEVAAITQKAGVEKEGELRFNAQTGVAPCGCPTRKEAPLPPELPFAAKESNTEKLKEFLLRYYKSSTFNVCPHQPLPLMQGPPLEFRMKPDAKPPAIYTADTVAAHWEKKVKEDIDRDVRLGVLEKVELDMHCGTVDWCHRMVLGKKSNGDPRRTVDFSPWSDQSIPQCHPTAPPLQQASTVPKNTKKSTVDAWNGFHSVQIREEDRYLTTFLTPWGRY